MKYQQLSIEEREALQLGLWAKHSLRDIARELGRSPSSLSREIKRNGRGGHYAPRKANQRALQKRKFRGREIHLKNDRIREYVISKLHANWSPEQISGRLYLETGLQISHEAIYQYIYHQVHRNGWGELKPGKEDLRVYLKRRHKRRVKKGFRGTQKVSKIKGKSIDLRPDIVLQRKRVGDWEGDSMVSRQSAVILNTLVERKTGLVMITKAPNKTAIETASATITRMNTIPVNFRRTITWDNGTENANLQEIEQALCLDCYLAHPYHSWERGTNENTNGLIRWYLPKKTDFATISAEQISAIEYALNTRPRKRLGWKTPLEVFNQSVALHS